MILNSAQQLLLRPVYPRAVFTDLQSNATGLTTYTFTGVSIGPPTGTLGADIAPTGNFMVQRMNSLRMPVIIVHTKASTITWTITSCTLGGVAGGKVVDRGGATNAINTAIFQFPPATIEGITNTDVVVTGSKALLGCAIGVCYVENMYIPNAATPASASGTATAATNMASTLNTDLPTLNFLSIFGSTCTTASLAETARWSVTTAAAGGAGFAPIMLYEGGDAVQSYSAAWQVNPGYCGNQGGNANLDWSGAGAFDWVTSVIR